ncbi:MULTISPECIES: ATP-binding protein [Streptomyces]|uniref:ATP-binding protein n=1 Tax=Streptomyces achmelvichensis TaxID=3134111 RepID=A0ACC6PQJ4_9ACTN|nr:ATP-binding protein [Streptomyces sp. NBC_01167]
MIASEESSQFSSSGHGPYGGTSGLAQCAMSATPEAARTLRHFARAVARRWRLHDEFHEALSVIVTELVSNVVLHSGSTWVALAIKVRGNTLVTEVRDGGRWKHRHARRQEPLDAHADCGQGLRLVDAFATRTVTRRLPMGSVVAAEIVMPPHQGGPRPVTLHPRVEDEPSPPVEFRTVIGLTVEPDCH